MKLQIRVDFPREGMDALFRFDMQETVGEMADFVAKIFGLPVDGADWRLTDSDDRVHHRDMKLRDLRGRGCGLFVIGHVV